MIILGIETSCDDTAIAIIKADGIKNPRFFILANVVSSQIKIHSKYGGVYPAMAKREHQRNIIPVLFTALKNAELKSQKALKPETYNLKPIKNILERETELLKAFEEKILFMKNPGIEAIAVTEGPGLEPTLWIGINFARALAVLWDIPIIGVDHMEGHIFANFLGVSKISNSQFSISKKTTISRKRSAAKDQMLNISYPALALAVSGGHTQLILIENWMKYKLIGETLDDAAGEAFDKVARLLGLPFPGGPAIEREARNYEKQAARSRGQATSGLKITLPRPMLNTKDYNFSFSGLKTAVLYDYQKRSAELRISKIYVQQMSYEFQQAVIDVLIKKTLRAAKTFNVKTVMLGGGVAANKALQEQLVKAIKKNITNANYRLPTAKLATDNGAMIAAAGYAHLARGEKSNVANLAADSTKIIQ